MTLNRVGLSEQSTRRRRYSTPRTESSVVVVGAVFTDMTVEPVKERIHLAGLCECTRLSPRLSLCLMDRMRPPRALCFDAAARLTVHDMHRWATSKTNAAGENCWTVPIVAKYYADRFDNQLLTDRRCIERILPRVAHTRTYRLCG